MKPESLAFGIAGVMFGLIAGWVIGAQQTAVRAPATQVAQAAPSGGPPPATPAPAAVDESAAAALRASAEREPSNPKPRVQLGNMYFDAERYTDAIRWYEEAIALSPKDVNLSTDLGVSYYYTNQADKAIEQFGHSLAIDPKHTKTLLNLGIVRAFGKQDLQGAGQAWEQVMQIAPDSPEGQAARRALEGMRSAHPDAGATPQKPGA